MGAFCSAKGPSTPRALMRSVAVLLVVVLGLVGAVPPSHSSKAIVPDEGKQSPIPTIAKNLKPKQRDNRRPAGFRPALDLLEKKKKMFCEA